MLPSDAVSSISPTAALLAEPPSEHLPAGIARFDDAQRRTIAYTRDVLRRLEAGMSERDIYELVETRREAHGFTTWYHHPEVRVGGRGFGPLAWPSSRRRLAAGDLFTLDLAPADADAYGDFGTTTIFAASEAPPVVEVARTCTRAVCGYASRHKTIGELFVFAQAWAINHRMKLANRRAMGHRVIEREGLWVTGFPRSAHYGTLLARNRVHRLNPVRLSGMFAIRPEVIHDGRVAAFEEILYIHEGVKRVLGRGTLAEVGTLGE